jgi:hypothetical protein
VLGLENNQKVLCNIGCRINTSLSGHGAMGTSSWPEFGRTGGCLDGMWYMICRLLDFFVSFVVDYHLTDPGSPSSSDHPTTTNSSGALSHDKGSLRTVQRSAAAVQRSYHPW